MSEITTKLTDDLRSQADQLPAQWYTRDLLLFAADALTTLQAERDSWREAFEGAKEERSQAFKETRAAQAETLRLRGALERIANPPYGLGFNKLRGLARKALNPYRDGTGRLITRQALQEPEG